MALKMIRTSATRVIALAAIAVAAGCSQKLQLMKDDSKEVLARHTINAENPARTG